MPSSPSGESGLPADLLRTISQRKMVRSYTEDAVDVDALDAIIHAAHSGPSAGNTRSLDLLVLQGVEVDAYWDTTLPDARRASFPWPGLLIAPVLLVPYVNPDAYVERYGESDKERTGLGDGQSAWAVPYWWVDGGAAAENILLAATALGLGACLFGQFEHETSVRDRFGVPEGRRAVATIAIGHPNEADDRSSRSSQRSRRPLEDTTHFGRW